jgi:protoporphyrinogen oxidase
VTLVEAASEPGGMAAHFDFGGLSIERFYHFACKSDQATFDLLAELSLRDRMRCGCRPRWDTISMAGSIPGAIQFRFYSFRT